MPYIWHRVTLYLALFFRKVRGPLPGEDPPPPSATPNEEWHRRIVACAMAPRKDAEGRTFSQPTLVFGSTLGLSRVRAPESISCSQTTGLI